jgi:hypothetical protein
MRIGHALLQSRLENGLADLDRDRRAVLTNRGEHTHPQSLSSPARIAENGWIVKLYVWSMIINQVEMAMAQMKSARSGGMTGRLEAPFGETRPAGEPTGQSAGGPPTASLLTKWCPSASR